MRRLALLLVLGTAACYTGGPYGYDRHYRSLSSERPFIERSQEAVYNEVRNDPEDFQDRLFGWFGAVEGIEDAADGRSLVRMSFRTHQERHLCADLERETCRVTVSQASSGTFSGRLTFSADDRDGRNQVAPGSLLRVYCQVTGEYDADGGPLVDCEHYRHWPRGQWAHTGMRGSMRR